MNAPPVAPEPAARNGAAEAPVAHRRARFSPPRSLAPDSRPVAAALVLGWTLAVMLPAALEMLFLRPGADASLPAAASLAPTALAHAGLWAAGLGAIVWLRRRAQRDRLAEQERRRMEERHRVFANIASDFLYSVVAGGDLLVPDWVSGRFHEIVGHSLKELRSRGGWASLVHPDDRGHFDAFLARLHGGRPDTLEYRIVNKAGEVRWLRDYAQPFLDDAGQHAVALLGGVREITREKQTEAGLRADLQRFGFAFEATSDAVWERDLRTDQLVANSRWFTMLGYVPGEIETSTGSWRQLMHPDDREKFFAARDAHLAGAAPVFQVECRLRTREGAWMPILARGRVSERDAAGAPLRIVGTHVDLTPVKEQQAALERSEAQFRSLFTHMTDGFALHECLCDGQGNPVDIRCLAVNPAYEKLTGLPAGAIVGRCLREVLPATDPAMVGRLGRVARDGEPCRFEMPSADHARVFELVAFRPEHGRIACIATDITARRQSEEEARRRQHALESMRRISELVLQAADDGEVFDRIAAEVALMSGYPFASIAMHDPVRDRVRFLGRHGFPACTKPVEEIPTSESLTALILARGEAVVETDPARLEAHLAPVLRPDGITVFVGTPIAGDGRILGVLSVASNQPRSVEQPLLDQLASIANHLAGSLARMDAQRALRRNQIELSAIYDEAPVLMCLLDGDGMLVRANRAVAEFASRPPEQLFSHAPGDIFGCLSALHNPHGCGHGLDCTNCVLRRTIAETLQSGVARRQVEVRKPLVRGGLLAEADLLVSTARLELDGQRRLLLVIEDITEQRAVEERVREQATLLDVARDAILVRDFNGRILYWNQGAARLYGWTPSEAIGRHWQQLLFASAAEPVTAGADAALLERGEWTGELAQLAKDRRQLTVQSRWTLVRDGAGAPRSVLMVNSDITETKRLGAQLLRAQRLESIGTLASGIAHDLNNVLSPVVMSLAMLREVTHEPASREMIETMNSCVRRGTDIVKQVLTFGRGVGGERIQIQPRHLVQEMARIARETFPRAIAISVDFSRDTGTFLGDPTQIQQVLMNLCVNARDAMPEGGALALLAGRVVLGQADLHLHPRAEAGAYCVFSVSDTGLGIAPELAEKIFDPFFTTKPIGQGTGLGLAVSLGIVEKHGGFIHFTSRVGHGTTFRVFLPAVASEGAPEAPAAEPAAPPRGRGQLVLVVDDEPAIRQIVERMLVARGYGVCLARDGSDALEAFRQRRAAVRIVVTDLAMPRMDGRALIGELRALEPALPVIVMSGLGDETLLRALAEEKIAGVLRKPFGPDDLLSMLDRQLSSARP